MSDAAITGMVVGVVGIVCFALAVVVLGVLAISRGNWFSGKASKESVELASGPDQEPKRTEQ
jgi:hypothetical protein